MLRGLIISFVVGAALGSTGATAAHYVLSPKDTAQVFAATWMGLLDRCRTAVETGKDLDRNGLVEAANRTQNAISKYSVASRFPAWHPENDGRVAAVMIQPGEGSFVTRACEVTLTDPNFRVHPDAGRNILLSFMNLRSKLMIEDAHAIAYLDNLYPGFRIGYETTGLNPAGCFVQTIAFFGSDANVLQLITTERPDPPCRGLSATTPDGGSNT